MANVLHIWRVYHCLCFSSIQGCYIPRALFTHSVFCFVTFEASECAIWCTVCIYTHSSEHTSDISWSLMFFFIMRLSGICSAWCLVIDGNIFQIHLDLLVILVLPYFNLFVHVCENIYFSLWLLCTQEFVVIRLRKGFLVSLQANRRLESIRTLYIVSYLQQG